MELVKVAILNIKQHKFLNIVMLLLFIICFSFILVYITGINLLKNYSNQTENMLKSRTINFHYNEKYNIKQIKEKIGEINNVELVSKKLNFSGKIINSEDISLIFNPIKDVRLKNENDILIPKKIFITKEKFIAGEKLVGKTIKLEHIYNEYVERKYIEEKGYYYSGNIENGKETVCYNVIGTYDETFEKSANVIFIEENNLINLYNKFNINSQSENKLEVIVKDSKYLQETWDKILEYDLVNIPKQQEYNPISKDYIHNVPLSKDVYSYLGISKNKINIIGTISNVVLGILIVIYVVVLIVLNIIQIIDNKYQIVLLKVQGYTDKNVKKILIFQNGMIITISYIIAFLLVMIGINRFITKAKIDFIIYIMPIILSICISCIVVESVYKKEIKND